MSTDNMEILHRYKIARCTNLNCVYNKNWLTSSQSKDVGQTTKDKTTNYNDGLLQYDCFNYHSTMDQRRSVLQKTKNSKSYSVAYSQYLAINCLNEADCSKHCLNGLEYLYHPLNFKKLECAFLKENKVCNAKYCPYFHTHEEEKYFNDFRKDIHNNLSFSVPLNDEFKNILKNLTEGLSNPSATPSPNKKESNGYHAGPGRKYSEANGHYSHQNNPVKTGEKKYKTPEGWYIYDQVVDFIEDHHHEFKNLKLNIETVAKYICGFLNSKGGILYFGINDSGAIKGIEMTDKFIQNFIKKMKNTLSNFDPPVVMDVDVSIEFVPVAKKNTKQTNQYIVEVKIAKETNNELYFTHNKEFFIKRSASLNQLRPKDIKEYVKDLLKRMSSKSLEILAKKLECYEGKDLDKLNKAQIEAMERNLKSTLRAIESFGLNYQ
jgi:hypothetical protein